MKTCQCCAESIQDDAVKCRHCKSDLNQSSATKKLKANQHSSYTTFTVLSLLLPIIGFILGIVYLAKSNPLDKKLGEHTLAMSVLFIIFWSLLFTIF